MAKRGPKGPSKWTQEVIERAADDLYLWFKSDHTKLFFKSFAHEEYDISWQTLYGACKENEKFSVAYKIVKEMQEERLAQGGLTGELHASMAYNTLKNVANWRDRQEISGDPDKPLIQTIERVIIKNDKAED